MNERSPRGAEHIGSSVARKIDPRHFKVEFENDRIREKHVIWGITRNMVLLLERTAGSGYGHEAGGRTAGNGWNGPTTHDVHWVFTPVDPK